MGGGADDGSYISTGLSYVGVVWVDSGWLFSNDGGGMTGHALLPVAVAGCRTASLRLLRRCCQSYRYSCRTRIFSIATYTHSIYTYTDPTEPITQSIILTFSTCNEAPRHPIWQTSKRVVRCSSCCSSFCFGRWLFWIFTTTTTTATAIPPLLRSFL